MRPLVVSLVLEPAGQQRFDVLRRTHFPAERLVVGAHVTLLHGSRWGFPFTPAGDAGRRTPGRPGGTS